MTKATRFDFEKVTAIKTEYLPEAAGEGDYGFKATKLSDAGDRNLRFCITVSAELVDDLRAIATGEKNPNLRPARPDPDPLARARKGEFGPLIRYVKNGGELTDKHRHMIAMIMNQMVPRVGRPPETKAEMRNRDIVLFAETLKMYRGKRVIDVTAAKFGVDRSYIPKLLKKYKGEGWPAFFLGCLLSAFGADNQTAWRAVLKFANISEADLREATGRKHVRK